LEHSAGVVPYCKKTLADVDEVADGHAVAFDIELGAIGGDEGIVTGDYGESAASVEWFAGVEPSAKPHAHEG
jgi:hypothetical protein